ncbi:conserved hypothetical protein [Vibrio nigripulchritudo MADA3029]|uniref:nuclear transport factor 2 family protein n=1 Tax=Vibrio nigripulchritudo TaxID=28173 RepID=UPI0003B21CD3|nr:nuclear transport factor 2 family protein [Vibrio nigripulchritudo]CCN48234.1 conserved hypothetical protein [Vibrio nigripulchritudo MADA3020]CCN54856.1 conserved hypothetical protein [Vibrio nigripulchritudo MADA3021]CCN58269.1 conserved hypothetical protein [Vibrio nigripulchritudo MADA3029]
MDIEHVADFYRSLGKHNLGTVKELYHPNVVFEDPAHRLEGNGVLYAYFESLYQNVQQCNFHIHESHQFGDTGFIVWTMSLKHPKLNRAKEVKVDGVSQISFEDNKVKHHRDYFDLGSMLYEQIPVLGLLIKKIKSGLGQ